MPIEAGLFPTGNINIMHAPSQAPQSLASACSQQKNSRILGRAG